MKEKIIDSEKLKVYIQTTRITIVICWIALFAFWVIKLFGGNWFEIVIENKNFVEFSQKVETTWLKYLVSFITISIANYLLLCAICQKFYFKGKQALVAAILIVSVWAISNFVPLSFFQFPSWYAYVVFIVFGAIYQKGKRKLFGLLPVILEPCFSIISFTVRNLPIQILSNYLICSILLIDVYIMICLYYLYSNLIKLKKGEMQ